MFDGTSRSEPDDFADSHDSTVPHRARKCGPVSLSVAYFQEEEAECITQRTLRNAVLGKKKQNASPRRVHRSRGWGSEFPVRRSWILNSGFCILTTAP